MLQDSSANLRVDATQNRHARSAAHLLWMSLGLLVFGVPSISYVSAQQAPAVATAEASPSFEVASIKPSRPGDDNHGWNSGGDRVAIENYTLRRLIRAAYGLKSD
jgi:hypothetical protein